MAKGILEFDLENKDDRQFFNRAIKSTELCIVLFELVNNSKRNFEMQLDADQNTTDRELKLLNDVWSDISALMDDNNINLDDLIS
jgi:hypothetical protein